MSVVYTRHSSVHGRAIQKRTLFVKNAVHKAEVVSCLQDTFETSLCTNQLLSTLNGQKQSFAHMV